MLLNHETGPGDLSHKNDLGSIRGTNIDMPLHVQISPKNDKDTHTFIFKIQQKLYCLRELREATTGLNVSSTALFHISSNCVRNCFPNMGSLNWKKLKVKVLVLHASRAK